MLSHKRSGKSSSIGRTSGPLLACVVAIGLFCGQAQAADAVLGPEAAKTIPIADALFHVMSFMDLAELGQYMDRNGIRWAGGGGAQGRSARVAEAAAALGKRYIRGSGQGQWISLKRQGGTAALENADSPAFKTALEGMERVLRYEDVRVIGEIHVNTSTSAGNKDVHHKIRADAPTLRAMFDLAAKYKRPMNVHAQFDWDTARELATLAESNRNGRLILAHCGVDATASDIRAFFEKHPNAYCDLSYRTLPQVQRNPARLIFAQSSGLRRDWKKLIEDYPERFMTGVADPHSWAEYEEVVRNIRFGLLANLSPATAEKVAYKNAQALFGLE